MIKKIKNVFAGDLIKVFSFTGLSTLVKLVTSYLTVKVVASIIGPSGITLIGQLQNFIAIITTIGSGGINNGVVKYVSEYKDDEDELRKYIRNGFKITVYLSFAVGLLLIITSKYLGKWILLSDKFSYIFVVFGICLLLLSLNNYLLSILNGYKEFKRFVLLNIITSVIGLIFTVLLVFFYHLKGALIATVSYQSVVLFFTIFFLRKSPWFQSKILWGKWDWGIVKQYFSYSLMALVSAATVPVSQLLVRGFLIKKYSMDSAGYWEGMNRISALYLMFITASFSVYYLPRLSEIKEKHLLKQEIFGVYKIITPIIGGSLFLIFTLKDFLITFLFSKEFYPMIEFFLWQLIGDFFKIMSWILAFVMVAKSMIKLYIITEIVFSVLFVTLSFLFIDYFGIVGVTKAYCLNYFLYFLAMIFIFRKLIFN